MCRVVLSFNLPDLRSTFRDFDSVQSLPRGVACRTRARILRSVLSACAASPPRRGCRFSRRSRGLPLLGFSKDPLHRHHAMRPVRARSSLEGRAWAKGMPPLRSFRSCRSSRLQRFSPHGRSQVCCTLLPILGFSPFGMPVARATGSPRAVYPSEPSSSSTSRTASPRPLSPLVVHGWFGLSTSLPRDLRVLLR